MWEQVLLYPIKETDTKTGSFQGQFGITLKNYMCFQNQDRFQESILQKYQTPDTKTKKQNKMPIQQRNHHKSVIMWILQTILQWLEIEDNV